MEQARRSRAQRNPRRTCPGPTERTPGPARGIDLARDCVMSPVGRATVLHAQSGGSPAGESQHRQGRPNPSAGCGTASVHYSGPVTGGFAAVRWHRFSTCAWNRLQTCSTRRGGGSWVGWEKPPAGRSPTVLLELWRWDIGLRPIRPTLHLHHSGQAPISRGASAQACGRGRGLTRIARGPTAASGGPSGKGDRSVAERG